MLKAVTLAATIMVASVAPAGAEMAISNLIGSYEVTGTEADGQPYASPGILDITLAPSGALELLWDNGKSVGIGRVIGDVLAVSHVARGRNIFMLMSANPDGSLSGKWWRRTDRGSKGTETWTKK